MNPSILFISFLLFLAPIFRNIRIILVHLLLFSESSIRMVARELGVSEERLHAVTQGLFDMLNSPRRGTGAAEETHPALASLSRKLLLRA